MGTILGDNLRALRTIHGITQKELADIAEVTRETVNKWENGSIGNIRNANLDNIRRHFNLSIDDLRSESRGLAASLQANDLSIDRTSASVPLVDTTQLAAFLHNTTQTRHAKPCADSSVPIPSSIYAQHPESFAMLLEVSTMSRVIPLGCCIIVDPQLLPSPNSIVLVATDNISSCDVEYSSDAQSKTDDSHRHYSLRRLHQGSTMSLLSTESYDDEREDIVIPTAELNPIGTVVWFQASKELS